MLGMEKEGGICKHILNITTKHFTLFKLDTFLSSTMYNAIAFTFKRFHIDLI